MQWSDGIMTRSLFDFHFSGFAFPTPWGGGTPGNSWWGCAARFSKSWPDFRPKNVIFQTRFQTRPLNSIPVFRPGLKAEIMSSLLSLERKYSHIFSNSHISLSFLLIWNWNDTTFIQSRSSLKNHTRFQTKMGKGLPCEQRLHFRGMSWRTKSRYFFAHTAKM